MDKFVHYLHFCKAELPSALGGFDWGSDLQYEPPHYFDEGYVYTLLWCDLSHY